MGVFPETLLLVQLNMKETTQETIIRDRNNSQNEPIWKQTSIEEEEKKEEDQEAINEAKAKSFNRIRRRRRSSSSNLLMKKRRSRSSTRIEHRVSTLRNLVPNKNSNNNNDYDEGCVGSLEQLFTQTADYILSLQTRVRLMKNLVDALPGSSSSSSNDLE